MLPINVVCAASILFFPLSTKTADEAEPRNARARDDVRTAVFGYFDTLAPGDTTPASRWPTTGSSVLYRGGLAAAMVTGASLLSATISLPASDQTPVAKQVVILGQLLVTA